MPAAAKRVRAHQPVLRWRQQRGAGALPHPVAARKAGGVAAPEVAIQHDPRRSSAAGDGAAPSRPAPAAAPAIAPLSPNAATRRHSKGLRPSRTHREHNMQSKFARASAERRGARAGCVGVPAFVSKSARSGSGGVVSLAHHVGQQPGVRMPASRPRRPHLLSPQEPHSGTWPKGPQTRAFSQDRPMQRRWRRSNSGYEQPFVRCRVNTNGHERLFATYPPAAYSLGGRTSGRSTTPGPGSRGNGRGSHRHHPARAPTSDSDQRHTPHYITVFIPEAAEQTPSSPATPTASPNAFVPRPRHPGRSRAFLRWPLAARSHRTGPVNEVRDRDGGWSVVAFVSDASNLALTASLAPAAAKLVTNYLTTGHQGLRPHPRRDRGDNTGLAAGEAPSPRPPQHGVPGNSNSAQAGLARSPDGCEGA